jgi:hypothetical protein
MLRSLATILASAGLAMTPLASDAQMLVLPACGGGAHLIVVPGDPVAPDDKGERCDKACHAMTDRRGKAKPGKRGGCC